MHSPERCAALLAAVEATDDGLRVTDREGIVLFESGSFSRLVAAEPARRVLDEAMRDARLAALAHVYATRQEQAQATPRGTGEWPGHTGSVDLVVRTASMEYRVRGTVTDSKGAFRSRDLVVTWLRPCKPRHLSAEELRSRYGLTAREVRVSALLAAGSGSREIAQVLGISVHTARRHTEAVLRKLLVHTRREVRERLRE